ncbi:hypothetical protein NDU88_000914 [Pleurodeles waltl]|uniref:Uncharacterized protein n=1 Tax=Pleurodeles waltl TaxID=8319 RepID=A0AAV7TGC1_PLEWA|nr:hypothetical protein NDU88_000914 [Pleurodeles waltl]
MWSRWLLLKHIKTLGDLFIAHKFITYLEYTGNSQATMFDVLIYGSIIQQPFVFTLRLSAPIIPEYILAAAIRTFTIQLSQLFDLEILWNHQTQAHRLSS